MELKIDIPEGYEIDTEKSTLGHLILKEIKKNPSWEDFGEVKGWFVDTYCEIQDYHALSTDSNKNTFPSREEAEACLALSQLLQWRDKYNEGWKADFTNGGEKSYIFFLNDAVQIIKTRSVRRVLCFKDSETAEKFLSDFRDLIEIAKPLL